MSATTTRPLNERAVIVTGGGTGIGRETAVQLADAGADVLIVGRTAARLEEVAKERPGVRTLTADVGAPGAPAAIVAAAVEAFGRVDALVNNAAIIRPAELTAVDRETAQEQLTTNLLAPLLLAREAVPQLEATGGTIVNVTSNPPLRGWPGASVYGATKVALDFLTHTWALELAPRGILVVSVAPGVTETPVLAHAGFTPEQIEATAAELRGRIPLGRVAEPAEIAWWIVNALRPEASYVTGAVLRVDGGFSVA